MIEQPLITVIVPVFNVEKYLEKCVNSIINQEYDRLQIILVDDGSTDNSGMLCDEFSKKDNRIEVIHKNNGGLSSARNCGLDHADGDYIAFVDSDDYLDKDMYLNLLNACVSYNCEIAVCGRYLEYEGSRNARTMFSLPTFRIMDSTEAIKCLLLGEVMDSAAWDKLYHANLFDSIRYPNGVIHEDLSITTRLLFECKKIVHIGISQYHYLQRQDSICRRSFSKKRFDMYDQALLNYEFVSQHLPQLKKEAEYFLTCNIMGVIGSAASSKSLDSNDLNRVWKLCFEYTKYAFGNGYCHKWKSFLRNIVKLMLI